MDTKEFIQGIITNELTGCFADCSQDNIDKLVDILNRHHEHQAKDNKVLSGVSGSFSQNDMENFAAKCMILGSNSKDIKELLKGFCDNDH
tara:strand:- start:756 stop:1025 length:270 start_codon:yes stop_codon:yes gene_type:complete